MEASRRKEGWREWVSVGNSALHEGWGAGKTDPPGGSHIIVNRKKWLAERSSHEKQNYRKRELLLA